MERISSKQDVGDWILKRLMLPGLIIANLFIFLLSFGSLVAAQSPFDLPLLAGTESRLVVFEGFYRPT
jgi:hypothetical protein